MWSQSSIRWAHAALLFAVCGAASSQVLNLDDWASYVLPVPFGIVAAWLCVGRVAPGIALVILDAVVWQLAYRIAVKFGADGPTLQRIAAMYLAGLVGGLGVSLATALVKRHAPAMRAVGICALAGGVCGLPFGWWLDGGKQAPIPGWAVAALCFAIWQAAVGVCLWGGFRLGKPEREG